MRGLALAVQFLTRLPISVRGEVTGREVSRAGAWFGMAGLVIGALVAGLDALFALALPALVRAVLDAVAVVLITGGLHLDGLMDTADGVGSGRPRERALEIMKDSRVGALGAQAGIVALLLRVALYASLPVAVRWQALLLAPALSRAAIIWSAARYPSARAGLGSSFAAGIGARELCGAGVSGVLLTAAVGFGPMLAAALGLVPTSPIGPDAAVDPGTTTALFRGPDAAGLSAIGPGAALVGPLAAPLHAVLSLILAVLVALGVAAWLNRRLGGQTGDTYGALSEITELAALVGWSLHWGGI